MAKGNMLQGMATGKLGDVVFARANGEQISRVRNRHPKNPRSNKQMYQRAVMATVMQAYSAGQEIFNHAFQGKSVGAENQRAFLSKNSKLLRGLIAAEIEAGTAALNCNAAVVAPGAITPVPNEYMISEGTYPLNLFTWNDQQKAFACPASEDGETAQQYLSRVGLTVGDIYTFVFFATTSLKASFSVRGVASATTGACKPESQYPAIFAFVRLQVKDYSSLDKSAASFTFDDVFENIASKNVSFYPEEENFEGTHSFNNFFDPAVIPNREMGYMSAGVIRSRLDQDLRSTSFMHVCSKVTDRATKGMYGITSPYALAAWQQGTEALGDSDLILEGGDE